MTEKKYKEMTELLGDPEMKKAIEKAVEEMLDKQERRQEWLERQFSRFSQLTTEEINSILEKIINKYDTNAEEAEKRILGESAKQSKKGKTR
jgi:Glu-tRNA(Gln) amidotransferase subunit E-like FAD-binding protein